MSDLMLLGVLRMPPELWNGSPLDIRQRHSRYMEAAARIESDAAELEALRADAERYRWLRENAYVFPRRMNEMEIPDQPITLWILPERGWGNNAIDDYVDAAIDAARGDT